MIVRAKSWTIREMRDRIGSRKHAASTAQHDRQPICEACNPDNMANASLTPSIYCDLTRKCQNPCLIKVISGKPIHYGDGFGLDQQGDFEAV